jgi:hypothetical protein
MIYQYADFFKDIKAITYEHNEEWVKFFSKSKEGCYNINIRILPSKEIEYKDVIIKTYDFANDEFAGKKFDFILLDGIGSQRYSRSQILSMIENLCNNFCVIIDDSHRECVQETILELKRIFDETNINYCDHTYSASKQHYLICSENWKFLTSLS